MDSLSLVNYDNGRLQIMLVIHILTIIEQRKNLLRLDVWEALDILFNKFYLLYSNSILGM